MFECRWRKSKRIIAAFHISVSLELEAAFISKVQFMETSNLYQIHWREVAPSLCITAVRALRWLFSSPYFPQFWISAANLLTSFVQHNGLIVEVEIQKHFRLVRDERSKVTPDYHMPIRSPSFVELFLYIFSDLDTCDGINKKQQSSEVSFLQSIAKSPCKLSACLTDWTEATHQDVLECLKFLLRI